MKIIQNSDVPIYKQIVTQFKEDILAGKYESGATLPSIRGLAKDLKISVITTMKAYDELASEGLVTAVQGKGYIVNAQDTEMIKEQHLRRLEDSLSTAIDCARIAGVTRAETIALLETLWQLED